MSGQVTLIDNPDHETKDSYSFTVVAEDASGNSSQQGVALAINNIAEIAQLGSDLIGEAAGDEFGLNTALSADGSILAVGARRNDGNGSDAGHVRVYRWVGSTNSWSQIGSDIDGEAAADYSGQDLSLSSDGLTLAIGGSGNDDSGDGAGHVRLYRWNRETNDWEQKGNDIDGEAAGDVSGISIGLSKDGNTVAVGAIGNDDATNGASSGHVQVYQWDEGTGTWNTKGADLQGTAADDWSGYSLALSDDAGTLAIGANQVGNSNPGYVRIYQWDGSGWQQQGADINGETAGDWSGHDVALSADGSIVAIGAPKNGGGGSSSGHVRIYQWSDGSWVQLGGDIDGETAGDESGSAVALSADGLTVAIGAPGNDGNGSNAGHARVYTWDSNSSQWVQHYGDIDGSAAEDLSGSSVSLSADGSRLTVGAYKANEGQVRAFQLESLDGPSVDNTAPLFLSGTTAAAVEEGTGTGQVIYTAISADESAVTYSLKASNSDEADHFTIDASTGEVTLNDDPTYATQQSYRFTVVAEDEAGNSAEQEVSLAVIAPPAFQSAITSEDGTKVILSYDQTLSIDTASPYDFVVTVDGVIVALDEYSPVSINGSEVELTLASVINLVKPSLLTTPIPHLVMISMQSKMLIMVEMQSR